MRRHFWQTAILVAAGASLAATGCGDPPIRSYTVARPETPAPPAAAAMVAPAPASGPGRMISVIAERPDAVWFFKIFSEPDRVAASEPMWRAFFSSLDFSADGSPQWTLPEGWQTSSGPSGMRWSTLVIDPGPPPLELAVTRLPPGQDRLFNVNRWRQQLGLSPLTDAELETALQTIQSKAGPLLIFDAAGPGAGEGAAASPPSPPEAGESTPPAAGAAGEPSPSPPEPSGRSPADAGAAAEGSPFEFRAPEHWQVMPSTPMRVRNWLVVSDAGDAQIAVLRLGSGAGDWNKNVDLWCRELGLEPLSPEAIEQQSEPIEIGGVPGRAITLVGQLLGGGNEPRAMRVASVTRAR